MDKFKENLIFEMYKDKSMSSAYRFRNELTQKYNITDKNANDLYKKVINYQISKYGEPINGSIIVFTSYRKRQQARQREYYKRKYHELERA